MRCVLLLCVLVLVGCHVDSSYTINGTVPDPSFNGEYVYMIPIDDVSTCEVDSALIINSAFAFNGMADTVNIFILRAQKPLSRFELQDILVITEPGAIFVKFDDESSSGGTVLNDSLQKWKEGKESIDNHFYELSNEIGNADSLHKVILSAKFDSLKKVAVDFHYNFVKNNRDNVVGELVNKFMSSSFTNEQKEEIGKN